MEENKYQKIMKFIKKDDFLEFVNNVIKDESKVTIGVKSKGTKFVFDRLDSAEELRLDYDMTILPPKKYFLPPIEVLLKYKLRDKFSLEPEEEFKPLVIIGIHPYDLIAIKQMDIVFNYKYPDYNYIRRRELSILVCVNIKNVSPYSFAGSMGTAIADDGFDLMLTDIGDGYAIEIGSEKGDTLIKSYARVYDVDDNIRVKVQEIKKDILSKFKKKLNFPVNELPGLLEKNYESDIWNKNSVKCLGCGSCNLVCPTCFCFDVQDLNEINLVKGERVRTWDGCVLEEFAKVATGENFRRDKAARYRHRFVRKGKYIFDRFGFIACVGCGRCASACLPDIADPCKVFNSLRGA